MTDKKKITKINSTQYLTDSNGNPILNKDGSPRKKGGRPKGSTSKYSYSSEQKKKIAARKALKQKRSTVEKLEKKLQAVLKDVDKTMRGSGLSAPAFSNTEAANLT